MVVRTRPASAREAKQPCLLQLSDTSLKFLGAECFSNVFSYDAIFEQQATQGQVFDDIEGIVLSVLQGFNGTICAYGQTGKYLLHQQHDVYDILLFVLHTTFQKFPTP